MIMNENIDLTKILKDCPRGTKLYSTIFGEVEFESIHNSSCSIKYKTITGRSFDVTCEGKMFANYDGECTLYPSKDQRDWSKFKTKLQQKFDPKTLNPFDKVLVRDSKAAEWTCGLFSHISFSKSYPFKIDNSYFKYCIPYNDDTKHLVGTTEEAPEYYSYDC